MVEATLPLTLEQVKDRLDVNDQQIVTSGGPFYGLPAFVAAFWLREPPLGNRMEWLILEEYRVLWPDLPDAPGSILRITMEGGLLTYKAGLLPRVDDLPGVPAS